MRPLRVHIDCTATILQPYCDHWDCTATHVTIETKQRPHCNHRDFRATTDRVHCDHFCYILVAEVFWTCPKTSATWARPVRPWRSRCELTSTTRRQHSECTASECDLEIAAVAVRSQSRCDWGFRPMYPWRMLYERPWPPFCDSDVSIKMISFNICMLRILQFSRNYGLAQDGRGAFIVWVC